MKIIGGKTMKIIESKIKESEMTSSRKKSLMYSAQLLCEAFYGAAQNSETIYAGKDIDEVVEVWTREFTTFIRLNPMWVDGKFKMDQKDKNIRVKHFISELIRKIK